MHHGSERRRKVDTFQHPRRQARLRGYRRSVTYLGQDLLALAADERARAGVFLAFQYPVELPGVNNMYFLRTAMNAARGAAANRNSTPRNAARGARET